MKKKEKILAIFLLILNCSPIGVTICKRDLLLTPFCGYENNIVCIRIINQTIKFKYDINRMHEVRCEEIYNIPSNKYLIRRENGFKGEKVINKGYNLNDFKIIIEDTSIIEIDTMVVDRYGWIGELRMRIKKDGTTYIIARSKREDIVLKRKIRVENNRINTFLKGD